MQGSGLKYYKHCMGPISQCGLKTVDTIGNCQRPVFSLGVYQHCIQQQTCENLSLISRVCSIVVVYLKVT